MCAGTIDGTHIPILAPEESHLVYVNTDTSALSCKQCWILIIYSEILSKADEAVFIIKVLSNSSIYQKGNHDQLFPKVLTKEIQGKDVSPFIFGDPAYPLPSWLIKPYQVSANSPPTYSAIFSVVPE